MTFKEIIESYGKELSYACTITTADGTTVADIEDRKIASTNIRFDGALYTSVMRCLDLVLIGDYRQIKKGYKIKGNMFTARKGNNENTVRYGTFIVAESPEYDEGADRTKLVCYDLMFNTMQEYKLKVTYPITLKNYLLAVAEACGFTVANIRELKNNVKQITEEKYLNNSDDSGSAYKYRDVLDDIARCAGCSFAFKSDANGEKTDELYIIYVTDGNGKMKEPLHTLDISNFKSLTIGEQYGAVNTVIFSRQPQEDNVYLNESGVTDETAVGIKLRQPLIAEGTDEERISWLNGILTAVKGTGYSCYTLESYGIGYLNFGDVFRIKAFRRKGLTFDYNAPEEYTSVFMRTDMLIDGDVKEKSTLEMPVATSTDYRAGKTAFEKQMREAWLKVDKSLGEIISFVKDPESGLSTQIAQCEESVNILAEQTKRLQDAGYITEDEAKALVVIDPNEIVMSVTQNIRVGARNILSDSACFEKVPMTFQNAEIFNAGGYKIDWVTSRVGVPSGKQRIIEFYEATKTDNTLSGIVFDASEIISSQKAITPGVTYTLSFWATADGDSKIYTLSKDKIVHVGTDVTVSCLSASEDMTLSDKPKKFVLKFTVNAEPTIFKLRFLIQGKQGNRCMMGISSLKLEEGNVATDWTPATQDVEQMVDAKIKLCVMTDSNGDLKSAIHAKANQITIESDNFTLDGEGNMTCNNASITGGSIKIFNENYGIGISIENGIFSQEFLFGDQTTPLFKIDYAVDNDSIYTQFKTNGLIITNENNGNMAVFFEDGRVSLPKANVAFSANAINLNGLLARKGSWSYGDAASTTDANIIEPLNDFVLSAYNSNLYIGGKNIWFCGKLYFANYVVNSSQKQPLYVNWDGEITT